MRTLFDWNRSLCQIAAWAVILCLLSPVLLRSAWSEETDTTTSDQKRVLSVANLNLLHDIPDFTDQEERLLIVADWLNSNRPDILLTQEASRHWKTPNGKLFDAMKFLAEHTGYRYVYRRANPIAKTTARISKFEEGLGLLSRYPISDVEFVQLWPSLYFHGRRFLLKADIETPHGSVRVATTHLINKTHVLDEDRIRLEQTKFAARKIKEWSKDRPMIFSGDLNAKESDPTIVYLAQEKGWTDTFRDLNPNEPGLTEREDGEYKARIDYIFTIPGPYGRFVPLTSKVFLENPQISKGDRSIYASDHAGVITEVTVPLSKRLSETTPYTTRTIRPIPGNMHHKIRVRYKRREELERPE